jgi:hypothetical protein
MFAVAITCIDPWVLEFMVSHTTGSNQAGHPMGLSPLKHTLMVNYNAIKENDNQTKILDTY